MSMNDQSATRRRSRRSWVVPGIAFAGGIAYLVTGIVGGNTTFGVQGLVTMWAFGVVLLVVRGRSETVQGLLDRRDERINAIDLQATAAAGSVLVLAVIVGFLIELARGNSGMPYAWLGGLAGVTYLVALVILRLRK